MEILEHFCRHFEWFSMLESLKCQELFLFAMRSMFNNFMIGWVENWDYTCSMLGGGHELVLDETSSLLDQIRRVHFTM